MTAVELFKKQVVELAVQMQHQKINLYQFLIELGDLGEQAKEMEKEQIIDAATWGVLCETPERYYKEKYKKD